MSITINGSGSISGLTAGAGVPASALSGQVPDANANSGGIIKVTQGFSSNTRTVYGQNTGTVLSGIDFRYPNDSRQTITFTKDNDASTSDIIIAYTMNIGGTFQCHGACLWKSDFSTHRMIAFDGHRNGTYAADSSDILTGSFLFTGLSAGSHTFYFSIGRRGGSSANMEWRINSNNSDGDDKPPSTVSEAIVYEVRK